MQCIIVCYFGKNECSLIPASFYPVQTQRCELDSAYRSVEALQSARHNDVILALDGVLMVPGGGGLYQNDLTKCEK